MGWFLVVLACCYCSGRSSLAHYFYLTPYTSWFHFWGSESKSSSVISNSLQPHGLYCPWNSLGLNTGVGGLSLHQGIFPTQGLYPGLLHCRRILYQRSHQGSPRTLEWTAYAFSCRFSQPRNWTRIPCISDGFFTNWAVRETPSSSGRSPLFSVIHDHIWDVNWKLCIFWMLALFIIYILHVCRHVSSFCVKTANVKVAWSC